MVESEPVRANDVCILIGDSVTPEDPETDQLCGSLRFFLGTKGGDS